MISKTTFAKRIGRLAGMTTCLSFVLSPSAVAAPPVAPVPPAVMTILPAPDGAQSCEAWDINEAWDVNDAGMIVGTCDTIPARWVNDSSVELLTGDLRITDPFGVILEIPIISGIATAVNVSGLIAGQVTTASGTRAAVWQGGIWLGLELPAGATGSSARDIDDQGRVIGTSRLQGTIWSGGQITSLPLLAAGNACVALASNESSNVVGQCNYELNGGFVPVVWKKGTAHELVNPRIANSPNYARTINETGQIGGTAAATAYVWNVKTPGKATSVATPGVVNSINDKKVMVGFLGIDGSLDSPPQAAWWRSATQGPVLLFPGTQPSAARAINNNSVVVGRVQLEDGTTRAFVAR